MASSKRNKHHQLYDEIRKAWVAATPEEIVRQQWLFTMRGELGYPKELISVETELKSLPHLTSVPKVPQRRADIICFTKNSNSKFPLDEGMLQPLLLMEIKADKIEDEELFQVIGYNYYVKAPFIALASSKQILFGYKKKDIWAYLNFLPSYTQLKTFE